MKMQHKVNHNEGDTSDEWATPREFVRPLAEAVGGFDLDPASGAEPEAHADTVYTKEDNGLEQEWFGNVFLNPPFSKKEEFVDKAVAEVNADRADLVVVVLPSATDTEMFHTVVSQAPVLCFLGPGRQEFDRRGNAEGDGCPSFAVMVPVFADRVPAELLGTLSNRGVVYWNRALHTETQQVQFAAQEATDDE